MAHRPSPFPALLRATLSLSSLPLHCYPANVVSYA